MKRTLAALFILVGLSGCASRWVVDSEVRSFTSGVGPVPAGAGYRFERLPSQQGSEAQQQLEAMAGPALEQAGLRRDDANPRYSAQIGARVSPRPSPWADPFFYPGGWYGRGWGGGYRRGWYGPLYAPPPPAWYAREVSVVLRDLSSNQVVYETQARNDGPYVGSASVLPVMFQAALQGFPNPPAGPRRVDIELPPSR